MESTQIQSLHTPDQITGFSDAKTMTPRQKHSQLSTPLMWPIFEKQTESYKGENKNLKNNQVAIDVLTLKLILGCSTLGF